jgi:hypothetical protein
MDVIVPVPAFDGLRARLKPGDAKCPHLSFDENLEASCAVHDIPEYENSPCWVYGNPDADPDFEVKRGRPCPVGQFLRSGGGDHTAGLATIAVDELEDLGPWPT